MNEGYNDSTDKSFQWNNTQSALKRTSTAKKENENESKNHSIRIQRLIGSFIPTLFHKFCSEIISSYRLCSFDLENLKFTEIDKEQLTKKKLCNIIRKGNNALKMSLPSILTKLLCMSVTCSIGVVLLLCMINVTYSTSSENNNLSHNENEVDDSKFNRESTYRNSRKYETFKSTARTSEELLNDITSYGLEKSRYLYEIKEKRIYDNGISLKKSDPAHFVAVFNKQTARSKELSRYGYATLEASSLLTKQ